MGRWRATGIPVAGQDSVALLARRGDRAVVYSPAMISRWLRRSRLGDTDPAEHSGRDADHPVGDLVHEGERVRLRTHVPANRPAFQRWYADEEIARLLRHDQEPLSAIQSRGYFETLILPLSARGLCFAIHEVKTDRLIGTTALTDIKERSATGRSALYRIVIGEKETWGRGYGTEATHLVVAEAFTTLGYDEVRLEVFQHNSRAIAAYRRVGFRVTGEHEEWLGRRQMRLHVVEMALQRGQRVPREPGDSPKSGSSELGAPTFQDLPSKRMARFARWNAVNGRQQPRHVVPRRGPRPRSGTANDA